MSAEIAKKKRVRAGHKASVTRIISDAKQELDATERNFLRLEQQRKKLQEKHETILKLDAEILEAEDEVSNEIEQADVFSDEMELTLMILNEALAGIENPQAATQTRTVSAQETRQATTETRNRPGDGTATENGTRILPTSVPSRAHMGTKVKLPKLSLKKFEGDLTTWHTFWDSYESSIHLNPDLSAVDKFNYLHTLVDGVAAEAIAGLALTSPNYEEAIALLKKRFGNKQQQISKHMEVLLRLEPLSSPHNVKGL